MATATTCATASKRSVRDVVTGDAVDTSCGNRARVTRRRTGDSLEVGAGELDGAKLQHGLASSNPLAGTQAGQASVGAGSSAVVGVGGCVMGVPCKGVPKPIPGPVLGVPQLPMPPHGCFPMGFPMGVPPPVMMMMMQQQMAAAMMGNMAAAQAFMPTGGCSMPPSMGVPTFVPPIMGHGCMPSMAPPTMGAGFGTPFSCGFPTAMDVPASNGFVPTDMWTGCSNTASASCLPNCLSIPSMPQAGALQTASIACPAANLCPSPAIGSEFDMDTDGKQSSSPSHAHTDSSRNSSVEQLALADQDFASFISSFLVPGADMPTAPPTGDPVLDLQLDLSDLMDSGEGLTSGPLGLNLSHDTLLEALASS